MYIKIDITKYINLMPTITKCKKKSIFEISIRNYENEKY